MNILKHASKQQKGKKYNNMSQPVYSKEEFQ